MNRLRNIGIQKRIMSYVAAGLAIMFAVTSFLGLESIQQATDLVFAERLNTARITAALLEAGFQNVADDIREAAPGIVAAREQGALEVEVDALLEHLSLADSSTFHRVVAV